MASGQNVPQQQPPPTLSGVHQSYPQYQIPNDASVGIVLPSWFLKVVGAAAAIVSVTLIPWAVWQTRATMRIEIRQESQIREQESLRRSTESLQVKLEEQADRIDEQSLQIYRIVSQNERRDAE